MTLSRMCKQHYARPIHRLDIDVQRRHRRVGQFVVVTVSLVPRSSFLHSTSSSHSCSLSYLASTLASILDNGYCTKDNCSNDTLANHMSHAATALPEEAEGEEVERSCDTLFMCIVTTLNKGLRNGGGIGDVLRQPSSQVSG